MSGRLLRLQQEYAGIEDRLEAITAQAEEDNDGNFSEEQDKEFAGYVSDRAKIKVQIDREHDRRDAELRLDPLKDPPGSPPKAKDDDEDTTPESGPFKTLGEFLQAVAATTMGQPDQRLLDYQAAALGGSANINSDGAFLIQTDHSQTIMQRIVETGILLSRVDRIPVGDQSDTLTVPYIDETSRANGSRWGGVQVYRSKEATAVTSTKPKMGEWKRELEDMTGLAYITKRLLRDAPAVEKIYGDAMVSEFGFKHDDEILNGTGAGQCLGILSTSNAALVTIAKENLQGAATIQTENLVKMWGRMPLRNRSNAVWLVNEEVEEKLPFLTIDVGTGGVLVYMPPGGLTGSQFGTLWGRPVLPIEQCPSFGSKGDIVLTDLNEYALIEKDGLQADSSMHVQFITHEMTFRWIMRTNGAPKWGSAVTTFKNTNRKKSPYITLAARP